MMELMDEGADIVYGRRLRRRGETWFKKTSAAVFYRLLNCLTDVPIPVDTGDFRLMRRRIVDLLNEMPEQYLGRIYIQEKKRSQLEIYNAA